MHELHAIIRADRRVRLEPPADLPSVSPPFRLPPDLIAFYEFCGGLKINHCDGVWRIVGPPELTSANAEIVGVDSPPDISDGWFIIARDGVQLITIDLDSERLGRCYDGFWDVHGVPGSCAVVADSFTELMRSLLKAGSVRPFWREPDFVSLGDAYD